VKNSDLNYGNNNANKILKID